MLEKGQGARDAGDDEWVAIHLSDLTAIGSLLPKLAKRMPADIDALSGQLDGLVDAGLAEAGVDPASIAVPSPDAMPALMDEFVATAEVALAPWGDLFDPGLVLESVTELQGHTLAEIRARSKEAERRMKTWAHRASSNAAFRPPTCTAR